MMMKILFINPPTPEMITNKDYYIPTGLLSLIAFLEQAGFNTELLDLNVFKLSQTHAKIELYENIIIDKIRDFQPSLIGIGCLFSGQFPSVLMFSEKIKKFSKNLPIVLGGLHPSIYPKAILENCPSIDWIIIGEGEESMFQLVNALKNQSYDFREIDGFAYREGESITVNPKKHFITHLAHLPFPAYDKIKLRDYYLDTSTWHNPKRLPINASIPIISSRSCPVGCNFCSMFIVMGHKLRTRSPENVADEIELLYTKYNHRHFSFMDDNMTLSKPHVLKICDEIIKRGLNIQFEAPNGVAISTLDDEVLEALVKAGLVRVAFGIESGSDFIRDKVMGKRISQDKIFAVINAAKKYRLLFIKAFFIIGMPEDTKETLEETYRMIEELDVDRPMVSNVMPFPGTKLFEQCLRDKLFAAEINLHDLWKMDRFYYTGNKDFFIKPYKLELSELRKFRERFDNLTARLIRKKELERENYSYEYSSERF